MDKEIIKEQLKFLPELAREELSQVSLFKNLPKNTLLLKIGDEVDYIPLLMSGLIKVYTAKNDKELLLYYIQNHQSCIMSFSAALVGEPSKIYAETFEESSVLLIPKKALKKMLYEIPQLNLLFFDLFNIRYADLLDTIQQLVFENMEMRLLEYLNNQSKIFTNDHVQMSHRQIANDLGTAREVITRTIKKLEIERKIAINQQGIKVIKAVT